MRRGGESGQGKFRMFFPIQLARAEVRAVDAA